MFRIGPDEFVVLTGSNSVTDAEALAQRITALMTVMLHMTVKIFLSECVLVSVKYQKAD